MNAYDIIFTDIDGTFLNSKHELTARMTETVRRITERRIPFVLASSRMPSAIFPILRMAGIRQPIICYGGALLLDEHGAELYSCTLTSDQAYEAARLIETDFNQISWNAYSGHTWLCAAPKSEWILQEEAITGIQARSETLDSIKKWDKVHKLLCMGPPDVIAALQESLSFHFPDLLLCKSSSSYLEITNFSVSKGNAMEIYCRLKYIPLERTLAFGDNYNDLDMLLKAGAGYAMANAPEEIRGIVTNTAPDNDHDGIACIIDKLFF